MAFSQWKPPRWFSTCKLHVHVKQKNVLLTFYFQFVIITTIIILQIKVHNSNFNIFSVVNINPPITVPKSWIITRPSWRTENSRGGSENLRGTLIVWRTLICLFKKKYTFSKFGKRYKATLGYPWGEFYLIS